MPDLRTGLLLLLDDLERGAIQRHPEDQDLRVGFAAMRDLLKRYQPGEEPCGCGFVQTDPPSLIHFRNQRCTAPATVTVGSSER